MFELHLKGFQTKKQVKAFIEWYENQGEQNADIWFECRKDEGEIDVDCMPVDVTKKHKWEDNALIAHLDIQKKKMNPYEK